MLVPTCTGLLVVQAASHFGDPVAAGGPVVVQWTAVLGFELLLMEQIMADREQHAWASFFVSPDSMTPFLSWMRLVLAGTCQAC